jgi:rhodanese-related sulfurtransferase
VVNLKKQGIENAAALLGGFEAWRNAGYKIDTN